MKINKKGFTLVEVIIVVVIIGLLGVLVMPKISEIFGNSINKTMRIQENEVRDASILYLEDYCKNPIGTNKCRLSKNSDLTYSGELSLDILVSSEYIDPVSLQGALCTGCINFNRNEPTVYISCGEEGDEIYITEGYSCN